MAKQQATKPSLQIDAHTLSYLGISQQPFTASILSGDAIYTDATRDQMMATLRHHMQFSDLVLIVEGEQGSGKTTLFRQLIQNNIPNLFLISILAEATDTLVQLQQKMSAHLKSQGSASYLDQDLKNLQVFDQFPIVIIDDAHLLSDTTLQELIRYRSQLKHDKDTNLKILLLANPGMAKTLEDITDLQHNQLYVQQMPELSPKQVQAFIEHRLSRAGYRDGPVLPPETIQLIHKKSQGKPGQVMTLAVLMLEKHVSNLNRPVGNLIVKILGMVGVLLLAAGSIYFWPATTPVPQPVITEAPQTITDTASEPLASVDLTQPAESAAPGSLQQDFPAPQPTENLPADTGTGINPAMEIPAEPDPQPTDFSTSGIAPPTSVAPVPAPAEAGAGKPTDKPKMAAPAAAPVVPAAVVPAVTPRPIAVPAEPKPVTTPADKPDSNDNPQIKTELAALGIKDGDWLRQQNPAHWTLQVLGARDTTTLLKFAREHKLGNDSAWYETRLNGKSWFVMVHRSYTNADTARKGLSALPPDLQRAQPWVKSLAAIQKDLAR